MLAVSAAFVAGLGSSVGPCIAPRYVLLAAYLAHGRRPSRVAAFVVGCIAGYLVYACAGALVSSIGLGTHVLYTLLAVTLFACGVRTLMTTHECEARQKPTLPVGAAFIGGLSSSIVFSPCCAPIAFGLGLQATQHDAVAAGSLLLAFGLGHTLPLALCALAAASGILRKVSFSRDACATISGALLVLVGGLYAIVA
jgi:cytochrome c biogenesis protein CcdA